MGVVLLGLVPTVAEAQTVNVACQTSSLISALAAASSGTTTLALPSGCTYTLTSVNNSSDGSTGLPVITANVTIQGNGATITRSTASGTAAFRLLDVASGGSLTISSLTLNNGLANGGQQGGGAIFSHGSLTVSTSTFTNNSSPSTTGTSGGAINSSGTLNVTTSLFSGTSAQEGGGVFNQSLATITDSTFSGNNATIYGGGALLNAAGSETVAGDTFVSNKGPGGGAIDNDTSLSISDSTFNGNTAGGNGGGAVENFGQTTITQSTLDANTSPYGADILNYRGYTLAISQSIVGDGLQGANCDASAPISDGGYNIDSGSSCGFSMSNHSLPNTAPDLDALASNGGPTQTMALAPGSPALDAIPPSVTGCSGGTDQRGIARPQGSGCDVGAYELVVTSTDTQPPTVPTGLIATTVTSNSVGLSWSASTDPDGIVIGYTVYRNGVAVGSTGGATTYTDLGVYPGTTYQYTVDAVDGGGNHSAQSSPALSVTTTASGPIGFVQGASVSTGSQATSVTLQLGQPVGAGDLLVGWFGQYNSSGQVKVSDNVNGVWTRVTTASTTFGSGGDLAFYYVQNAKAGTSLTITISATSATYLQGAVSEFSGVATSGAFDQAAAASGNSTSVATGATATVGAGELVVGGIVTGGSPGTVTPGSSQGQPFVMGTHTSVGSADLEYIVSSAAGTQQSTATFTSATDWHAGVAVFHQFSSSNAPPSVPTGLSAPTDTASSVGLSWTASGGATGYTIYRNGTQIGTSTTTTYTDSTVSPSTTYQYTVDAYNGAGTHSAQSSPALSVTTPAAAPPSVPTGLSAPTDTASSVGLSWTASGGATGYTIYRNGTQIGTSTTTTYTDSTVSPSTTYQYTVDAYNGAGTHSAQSSPALSVTTPAAAPPSVPTGLSAPTDTASSVGLSWTASGGATGYTIYRNGTQIGTSTTTTYTDSTVSPSTTYQYTVDAYNGAGTHSAQSSPALSVTTPAAAPPSVPTGLSAPTDTASSVGLSWTASGGATGYTIYRNGTQIGTSTTTTYTDSTVSPSTTYQYTVDAYNGAGTHSAQSSPALSVTTPAAAPPSVRPGPGPLVSTGACHERQLTLGKVTAGDLLVGWFGQYDSSGQVKVSDNVNGVWTRVTTASTTFGSGGDLAFYYVQNAKAATSLDHHHLGDLGHPPPGRSRAWRAMSGLDHRCAAHSTSSPPRALRRPHPPPTRRARSGSAGHRLRGSDRLHDLPQRDPDRDLDHHHLHRLDGQPLDHLPVHGGRLQRGRHPLGPVLTGAVGDHPRPLRPPNIKWIQGASVSTGSLVTSVTLTLGKVTAGDLLVGWFGQYNSSGQVKVSDNVNGVWTRVTTASTTFGSGGDLAFYYVQNAKAGHAASPSPSRRPRPPTSKVRSRSSRAWPRAGPSTRPLRPAATAHRSPPGRLRPSAQGNWWSAAS